MVLLKQSLKGIKDSTRAFKIYLQKDRKTIIEILSKLSKLNKKSH
jgi:hypothetical protein